MPDPTGSSDVSGDGQARSEKDQPEKLPGKKWDKLRFHVTTGAVKNIDNERARLDSTGGEEDEISPSKALGKIRPVRFFQAKHILVEMNVLVGNLWVETHRWNFGLEQDLVEGHTQDEAPHLPWISAFGLTEYANRLRKDMVLLDFDADERDGKHSFEILTDKIAELVVKQEDCHTTASKVKETLMATIWDSHSKEHLPGLADQELERAESDREKYGYKNELHEDLQQSSRHRSIDDVLEAQRSCAERQPTALSKVLGNVHFDSSDEEENTEADDASSEEHSVHRSRLRLPSIGAADRRRKKKEEEEEKRKQAAKGKHFDMMMPEDTEEAADVFVGNVEWLDNDIVIIVRLLNPIVIRPERDTPAKFFCLILGPPNHEHCVRHLEMGEALAGLLQDEEMVRGFYKAESSEELLGVVDKKMHKLTLLPQIHRPTDSAIEERTKRMYKEMAQLAQRVNVPVVGYDKWKKKAKASFEDGFSAKAVINGMQKYAVPLLTGIFVALILKNVDGDWYDTALGPAHHDTSNSSEHRRLVRRSSSDGDGGTEVPTAFGFAIDGHDVNFYFIVNDVLMCFFFGLAAMEITESLSPGGLLYPIGPEVMNPLGATVGGVLGPVIVYFILLQIFDAGGAFEDEPYSLNDLRTGWGIPTATDIAICWAVAIVIFGGDHPAVKYLLLLAIVDDGIGLIIIATVYPDPDNPVKPIWFLLVLAGMVVAWGLRKLDVRTWWLYVILAGPLSWFGLLLAHIHPALALCFVVPFMPGNTKTLEESTKQKDLHSEELDSESTIEEQQALIADTIESSTKRHSHTTLQSFEHATKDFVDLFVLFMFGIASAGVDLGGFGPYTAVVALSLIVGKTGGIGCMALLLDRYGYPLPKGMSAKPVWMVAFIAGIGLTVALFISAEAYADNDRIAGEAKLGALLSLIIAPIAVLLAKFFDFSVVDLPDDESDKGSLALSAAEFEGGKDESMEATVVTQQIKKLMKVQSTIKEVEEETQVSRRETMRNFRDQAAALRRKNMVINAMKMLQGERKRTISGGSTGSAHSGHHSPRRLSGSSIEQNADGGRENAVSRQVTFADAGGDPDLAVVTGQDTIV